MAKAQLEIDGVVNTILMKAHEFKTGSVGYLGRGKVESHQGKYQVQIQAVLIGSKPKASK